MKRKVASGVMLTLLLTSMLMLAFTIQLSKASGTIHDVAVVDFVDVAPFKTVVGQGYTTFIMVTVENQGDFTETFNVTAYYNQTAISIEQWPDGANSQTFWSMGDVNRDGYIEAWDVLLIGRAFGWWGPPGQNPADINSDGKVDGIDAVTCARNINLDIWTSLGIPKLIENQRNVTLPSGNSTIVTFRWNTTGVVKGNYIVSANASQVPGETELADNSLVDGWITVAMIGDITGPTPGVPDGKVTIRDIALVAIGFGASIANDPNLLQYWHSTPEAMCPHNPYVDLTGQRTGVADSNIDIRDIATVAKRFGQIDP